MEPVDEAKELGETCGLPVEPVDGAEELGETRGLPVEPAVGEEELGETCGLPVEPVDGAEELGETCRLPVESVKPGYVNELSCRVNGSAELISSGFKAVMPLKASATLDPYIKDIKYDNI